MLGFGAIALVASAVLFASFAMPMRPLTALATQQRTGVPQQGTRAPDVELMRSVWNAWSTLDPAQAAPYYAKDPGLVFYDLAPLEHRGWDAYQAGARELLGKFKSAKFTPHDDAQVNVLGSHAIGQATVDIDYEQKDGKRVSTDARWTVVWERRGSDWLIVHEHVSAPMR
ncbi:YybH family protein [Polyangium aurulentum]|uniref:YybH family protein n=1 Tax=Polyangium aurulentum TaxID=2567896 RepID=UPI00146E4DDA|nr:nuclear transport factor 2 family protein [Polyangium aurulentum]UQA57322.1 nuclear transport factor 2 family protein [Polyangium aurulentum]